MRENLPVDNPLIWVGSSLDELRALPPLVQRSVGFTLRFVQAGETPENVKPLKNFQGAGVLEILENYDGDTFRAIYTVKLSGVIYVLHCFQKKSRRGIETPKATMDLIQQRFRAAQRIHKERSGGS